MDFQLKPLHWVGIAFGVFALLLLLGSCSGYNHVNGLRNQGIKHETGLTAQYLDNQNYLSAYISGFYEQVGLAQAQTEALNDILRDAVKGRYEDGGYSVDSAFFAAIVEAYPEAGPAQLLENWGKIQDYVVAERAGYRNMQSKLLDQLRSYDNWRASGIVDNFIKEGVLGFPSNRLQAHIGDNVFRGEDALDKMYRIILTSDALKAYETGTLDPLKVPEK